MRPSTNILKDGVLAMGDPLDIDEGSLDLSRRISRKFTIWTFLLTLKRGNFTFNNDFGPGRHLPLPIQA